MLERLADPELYLASAERVRARQWQNGDLRPLCEAGPRLAALGEQLPALARRLAREVSRGQYAFGSVEPRRAFIEGKQRVLFVATPLDDIVLGALSEVLRDLVEPQLSPRLHSYRRGRSPWTAIEAFRAYLRRHVALRLDPRERGLYVIRRDVRGYGDAIPVDAESRLWLQLSAALSGAAIAPTTERMRWLISAFRPAQTDLGERPKRGVPTGSSLQPIACNLYLAPIDRLAERVSGGFYARYGDDMLFAHPDPGVVERTMTEIDAAIAELRLELSVDKCAAYYFNGAGRASERPAFRGVSGCDYLGVQIDFRGLIRLRRDKQQDLLLDAKARLRRSHPMLDSLEPARRSEVLCQVINALLDPMNRLAHDSASVLRSRIDDRGQLRDLDYKLAQLVARTLCRRSGPRAFRRHSPRALREEGGLCSLVRGRDRRSARPSRASRR